MLCTQELAQLFANGESSGCCKTSSFRKCPYQTFRPTPSMGQHKESWLSAAGSRRELSALEEGDESSGARGVHQVLTRPP